jgi:hypothetical protein
MARSRRSRGGALTAARRNRLRASQFVFPGTRRYPIDTLGRARNALARVSQHGSASEKARVRAAVRRRWPSIAVGGVTRKAKATRRRR